MTKEYLKMADAFIVRLVDPSYFTVDPACVCDAWNDGVTPHEYAAHAIWSHDELVAEVERLRGELSVAYDALDEVDRVISERIKNGDYALDDISAEVSHAIERLSRDAD